MNSQHMPDVMSIEFARIREGRWRFDHPAGFEVIVDVHHRDAGRYVAEALERRWADAA